MTGPVDYNAVLADLEAKRVEIESAIRVISGLVAGSPAAAPDGNGAADSPARPSTTKQTPAVGGGVQSDTFFGLSTPAAVRKFLSLTKRPQSPRAIADALVEGGQVHATKDTAYTNVYTALKRGKNDFVQTRNKEWGLVEWYGSKPKGDSE